VPIVVERSFETASDIVTGPIARLGHRLSRSQAPDSRTANEEEVVFRLSAKRLELAGPRACRRSDKIGARVRHSGPRRFATATGLVGDTGPGTVLVGVAVANAGADDATARVRLNGTSVVGAAA
jgi:hypothetical protein